MLAGEASCEVPGHAPTGRCERARGGACSHAHAEEEGEGQGGGQEGDRAAAALSVGTGLLLEPTHRKIAD